MRRRVVRNETQHLVVISDRGRGAALAAPGRRRFLRVAGQQPQLRVVDVFRQRVVDDFAVRRQLGRVLDVVHGRELRLANRDASLLALADLRREGLGLLEK